MKVEEIKRWLKNKETRIWRRALLLLCETGKPMTNREVGGMLGIQRTSAWRTLKTLQIHSKVKSEKKKKQNTILWKITPYGIKEVRELQEKGLLPKREK